MDRGNQRKHCWVELVAQRRSPVDWRTWWQRRRNERANLFTNDGDGEVATLSASLHRMPNGKISKSFILLSTFVGRTLPGIGWVLLANDVAQIGYHTVIRYNRIVSPADRVF